jgi:hypothetical protein
VAVIGVGKLFCASVTVESGLVLLLLLLLLELQLTVWGQGAAGRGIEGCCQGLQLLLLITHLQLMIARVLQIVFCNGVWTLQLKWQGLKMKQKMPQIRRQPLLLITN